MSASTERKNRQAAREAGTDKKLLAAQEEATKKAASKRRWTIGTVIVVVFIALILFLNSGYFLKHTTAVTIGDRDYTPAELNYYYSSQFNMWYSSYGDYASMFGLDTSNGIAGLAAQVYDSTTGVTWKDYFMEQTFSVMEQETALCRYAEENGITLDEDDIAEVQSYIDTLKANASSNGYKSADAYSAAVFGSGVTTDIVYKADQRSTLAAKAYNQMRNSLEYSAAELEEKYSSFNGERDIFEYLDFNFAANKTTVTAEDGTESSSVTEDDLAAAKKTADAVLAAFNSKDAEAENADEEMRLNAALAAKDLGSATRSSTAGSSLGDKKEWLMGSRKAGDAMVIESSDAGGYHIVVFLGRDDNHYRLPRVRHILFKSVAGDDGVYTDEAKADTLKKAKGVYDAWKLSGATEDSFAQLAEEYSEDTGSNTNGGLYESLAKGHTVPEFDAFIYGDRKPGDTEIVYGESSAYTGYHIIYYIGEGEVYSDTIAKDALLTEDMETWLTEITEGLDPVKGFGYRFTV